MESNFINFMLKWVFPGAGKNLFPGWKAKKAKEGLMHGSPMFILVHLKRA